MAYSHFHLKDVLPFCPIPVPARLADRIDRESGCHFNSLRRENNVANSAVISLSLMLLHETTLSLSSSFHERRTDSSPCVVSNEHP